MPTGSSLLTLWLAGFDQQNQLQVLPIECQQIEDMDTGEWIDGVVYVNNPTAKSDELMGIIKRSSKNRVYIIKKHVSGRAPIWYAGDYCIAETTQKAALRSLLEVVKLVQKERQQALDEVNDHAAQVVAELEGLEDGNG